jgi:hypothetical protein
MTTTNSNVNSNVEIISVTRTKDVEVIKAPGMTIRRHKVETVSKELVHRNERGSSYIITVTTKYESDIDLKRADDNPQVISSEAARSMSDHIDREYKYLLATGKINLESKDLV